MNNEQDELNDLDEEGFIVECPGSDGVFAVFDDNGETGYLYVYGPGEEGIRIHLRIYVRSPELDVTESDVQVVWSTDYSKCGVRIWGKMRGIINLLTKQEGRVLLESRDTPGIGDLKWLEGFPTE